MFGFEPEPGFEEDLPVEGVLVEAVAVAAAEDAEVVLASAADEAALAFPFPPLLAVDDDDTVAADAELATTAPGPALTAL